MTGSSSSRLNIGETDITAKARNDDRLRREFDETDVSKYRNLSYVEVKNFLGQKAGAHFDEALCQDLFASMNLNKDSVVFREEFIWSYYRQTRVGWSDRWQSTCIWKKPRASA